jgi:nucleoside-diphosphate-sugar epimerase
MKRALVCGAGGFIAYHLADRLKKEGYWVRAVDIKEPEFEPTTADEFMLLDLRKPEDCRRALKIDEVGAGFDEVYQLAADMGGMGFIMNAECDIMFNNMIINTHMINTAIKEFGVSNYFFSSSACVYHDQQVGENELSEDDVYPALPDNEYGWEKLYTERMAMAFGRHYGAKVRIARFQNTYGPLGTWTGGREKAPAAMCRKIAEVEDGGTIEIWGDGTAIRAYTYIDDLIDGIYALMHSDLEDGVNIGRQEYVPVDELARIVAKVAGKTINIKHIDGPVGVQARYFLDERISSIGWSSSVSLEEGIRKTYAWIEGQVKKTN